MHTMSSYGERARHFRNYSGKTLLELMHRKKTNLSVAVDVTKKADLLRLAEAVGPEICLLKTHIDIVEDFDQELVDRLNGLAQQHDFLIFEDRKFADIGNTVKLQYSAGVHRISSWAHITNAHVVPGPGVITGLSEVGLPLGRGLLLLAEMSSAGALAKGAYSDTAVEWARKNREFVIGFIAGRRLTPPPKSTRESEAESSTGVAEEVEDFIYMTPGVGLDARGDALGQQYRSPREVILESNSDIIIVGRGIYASGKDPRTEAKRYREAGWAAYEERIGRRHQ